MIQTEQSNKTLMHLVGFNVHQSLLLRTEIIFHRSAGRIDLIKKSGLEQKTLTAWKVQNRQKLVICFNKGMYSYFNNVVINNFQRFLNCFRNGDTIDLWTSYKYVCMKEKYVCMYVLRLKLGPENLLVPVSRSIVYI